MDLTSLQLVHVDLADQIAEIRISRPRALNALNRQVLDELVTALDALAAFDSLRCVILTGDGEKAFVAGADITEMQTMSTAEAREYSELGHRICSTLASFPVPVLAAVNGYALGGGCELALACDIIYASERAKLGQPEVKLGLIPGFGGTVRLARKVGLAAASEWIYTGEIYSAQTAQELGLVREVLPAAELMPRVRAVAKLIASRAPLAVRAAKRSLSRGMATDETEAIRIEQDNFTELFGTDDAREGTAAFVEKRDPVFKGS